MKYYLVALFDNNSNEQIAPIKRDLSKKYRLPRQQVYSHIILKTFDSPNIEKLDEVLIKMFKPYKKFKVELTGDIFCYENSPKNLNLKIENKGYIKKISRSLNDMLKLHGFNVRDERSQLSISINNSFMPRDFKKDFNNNIIFKGTHQFETLKIDRVELWKISNKKETIIKSYILRNY